MRSILYCTLEGQQFDTFSNLNILGLEELKNQRNQITDVVSQEELEKKAVEKEIRVLQNKLNKINNSLHKHKTMQENYDKAILDAETGFKKVIVL